MGRFLQIAHFWPYMIDQNWLKPNVVPTFVFKMNFVYELNENQKSVLLTTRVSELYVFAT